MCSFASLFPCIIACHLISWIDAFAMLNHPSNQKNTKDIRSTDSSSSAPSLLTVSKNQTRYDSTEYSKLAQHLFHTIHPIHIHPPTTNDTTCEVYTNNNNSDQETTATKYYWVAIAGGAGSGKTTCANAVAEQINQLYTKYNHHKNNHTTCCCVVVPMDGFHYTQSKLIELYGTDALQRRGAPWTFDAERMFTLLQRAHRTHSAIVPKYSREISDPIPNSIPIHPWHRIVLVEGLYMLHIQDPRFAPLYHLFHETWYVRAPTKEIQKHRLIQRSLQTWNTVKSQLWGPGIVGATKRVEMNDFQNSEMIEYCESIADVVIVTI